MEGMLCCTALCCAVLSTLVLGTMGRAEAPAQKKVQHNGLGRQDSQRASSAATVA